MTDETRAKLQEVIDLLDEVLDADDLTDGEFGDLNAAYHALEAVADEA